MTGLLIVSHGTLGRALLQTAESILGKQAGVRVVSNKGLSVKGLAEALGRVLAQRTWRADTLVLVDMPGGSCWTAASLASRQRAGVAVMGGMNLAMLLSFFSKRVTLERGPLMEAMLKAARDSVTSA